LKQSAGESPWFHICSLLAGLAVFGLGVVFGGPDALGAPRSTQTAITWQAAAPREASAVQPFANAALWLHVPVPAIEPFTPDRADWATTLADRPVDVDWLLAQSPERASAP
jgi:hypothetical protein